MDAKELDKLGTAAYEQTLMGHLDIAFEKLS